MKARSDFVTNSSSTSYIIVDRRQDKSKPIDIKITLTENLKALAEKIKLEHVVRLVNEEDIDLVTSEIEKGNDVYILDGDSGCSGIPHMLYENGIDIIEFPDGVEPLTGSGF